MKDAITATGESDDPATIAAFDMAEGPLRLERFPNGGWLVSQGGPEPGFMGKRLGAYSSAREMLDALECLA